MPYVKLSDASKPRPDRLKAVLLERIRSKGIRHDEVAEAMNVSQSTFQRLLKKHSDEWTVEQITLALRAVDVRLSLRTTNYELSDTN